MELEQLRQLVTICDAGTLSQAASVLHLSPSALSRSMKRLESTLHITLFERTRNSITPNQTGLFVADQARDILDSVDSLRQRALDFERRHHRIRMGACAPAPAWTLLTNLAERSPNLIVSSELLDETELERRLSDGTLDIAILPYALSHENLRSVHVLDEELLISLPVNHRLVAYKNITTADLDGETILVHTASGYWGALFERKLPHSDLIVRNDYLVFLEQVRTSSLPAFITDAPTVPPMEGRVVHTIANSEMEASFFANIQRTFADRWHIILAPFA